MPTKRSSWKELCHLFLPHSPVTRRNLEWGRYSVETCLSCRAADRRSTSKIRSVSKWSFGQFRSAFLSFTFIYCKYYHDPQWRKAGNYGENESWKTAIPYKYVSIFLGVLLCRSSIYIYYDNLYSILHKIQKQTEFVPVLFRPRNPMFAIHDIRALPQSSPRRTQNSLHPLLI
jgi:hypothetical protein